MAGCQPNLKPGGPQVACAGLANSLAGVATVDAEYVKAQCVILSTHMVPSIHLKGSLNYGGGGSGSGSGCGKKAPCSEAEEESKSCGGGGGGCGKSKKSSCCPSKFKVVFKDINGNAIPVTIDGKTVTIQEVEKQTSAISPWDTQEEISGTKYDLTSEGKTFDRWSNYDWKAVNKDIETSAVYRDLVGNEYYADNELLENKITEDCANKIQDFSDEYLNYKNGSKKRRDVKSSYEPRVKEYGKYNAAIDMCVTMVQRVNQLINSVFEILLDHVDEVKDGPLFEDIKKCLLNIQSSLIYQIRMSINLDLQDVQAKLSGYVELLLDKARAGEDVDSDIDEYRKELDLDLEFFTMDTKDRYEEFANAFNSYVDNLNKSCFDEEYIKKIKNKYGD